MDANSPHGPRRSAPTLAAILSEAAARQATTPTVRLIAHAMRGEPGGDPRIALFTGLCGDGSLAVSSFSFGGDNS